MNSRRGLETLLLIVAFVMITAGAATVLFGTASLLGDTDAVPVSDSELRFYAVWYVLTGIVLLRSLSRVEDASFLVRLIAGAYFVAGCGRALSWATIGRPHWSQVALMGVELILPFVIVPWQAAVSRRASVRPRSDP